MKAIYKYEVTPEGRTEMPRGAELLSVGSQPAPARGSPDMNESIFVWAIVDVDVYTVTRRLVPVPTGLRFEDYEGPKRSQFVGTVQMRNGLVFHIFDAGEA